MKNLRTLLMGLMGLGMMLGCIRSYCCAKKDVFLNYEEMMAAVDTSETSEATLPHDYPEELVYPDAWFTHGATGMMRAEAHPESHAHFMTYQPRDSVLAFYRNVKGWETRYEGVDSAGVYTIAMERKEEMYDVQFIADLVESINDESKPVIHIDISYGEGIGIRYSEYFKERQEKTDESMPQE